MERRRLVGNKWMKLDQRPTTNDHRRRLIRSMDLFAACLLGVIVSGPAMAQSLAVRADTLITVSGATIKNGVVIVRNGKITEVGAGLSVPSGMTVLHATVVMPGLVDPHSYLGCQNETDEPVDAVTPDSRACD